MKHLYKYLFLAAMLTIAACGKQLDLSPENNLVEEQVLQDKTTTERLLAGGFYTQFLIERDVIPVPDYSTGILFLTTNSYYSGAVDPSSGLLQRIWTEHYKVINIANVIINNLPREAKFDLESQKKFIAEAKFLRAYSYFRLALVFGNRWFDGASANDNLCVPLRLDAFSRSDESQLVARASNKVIMDQVVKDLEEAIPDLPINYPDATAPDVKLRSRAVKSVGRAFLSRVYLYLKNYNGVISNADQVIADGNYVLAAAADVVFPNNSSVTGAPANIAFNKEVVYGYPVSWNLALSSNTANNFQYSIETAFLQTYAADDMRGSTMTRKIPPSTLYPNGQILSNKYSSPNMYDNMMIIRLAEVMLNKAEALARRDGINQVSINMLNSIYQRAFVAGKKPALYTMSSFTTVDQLVDRLLQERRWELACEGQDRFDRLRSGKPVNPVMPLNRYSFPIPQAEISISNGVLVQNPEY